MIPPRLLLRLVAAGASLGVIAGGGCPAPTSEVTFEEARADASRRPAYLAQVVRKARPPRSVARVEYRDEASFRALLPP
ncbi:MAG TPA: hypothetical protein VGQ83_33530, partial [Polyangia bacterium]